MATLHEAVNSTKKIILFGTIAVVVLSVVYFIFTGTLNYIRSQQAPPPPDEAFGDLPDPLFPANATDEDLTYSIDTVTGDLPTDLPDRMLVYEIEEPQPNLNNLRDAKAKVLKARFATRERRITDTVYQWSDLQTFSRTLRMDIISGSFVYTTDFITNKSFTQNAQTITVEEAIAEASKFFRSLSSLPEEFTGSTEIKSFTVKNGKRIPSENDAETTVMEVTFFHKPITVDEIDYEIYYTKPDGSPINALVGNGNFPSVLEARYTFHKLSKNTGEYELKPVTEAYQELTEGKAYIASFFGEETAIKIQEVFLAYYIGEGRQQFTVPIYVFANRTKGFYAYVPAVNDYWNDPTPTPESE